MSLEPRVVVVTRPSAYRELLDRHGIPGAVRFFLRDRDPDELADLRARDDVWRRALDAVVTAVPAGWRLGRADRADLPAFGFAPGDVVVAVGPDGLVANVAKYLDDQPVLGVDPAGPGVLARHRTADLPALLARLDVAVVEERATVVAELDDGQRLRGLNEIFVGDRGHQSARYRLRLPDGRGEAQSSSGVIVGTGTGATGWCAALARTTAHPPLPRPAEPALAWFVREAGPAAAPISPRQARRRGAAGAHRHVRRARRLLRRWRGRPPHRRPRPAGDRRPRIPTSPPGRTGLSPASTGNRRAVCLRLA